MNDKKNYKIKPEEAADFLNVSKKDILHFIKEGLLKCQKDRKKNSKVIYFLDKEELKVFKKKMERKEIMVKERVEHNEDKKSDNDEGKNNESKDQKVMQDGNSTRIKSARELMEELKKARVEDKKQRNQKSGVKNGDRKEKRISDDVKKSSELSLDLLEESMNVLKKQIQKKDEHLKSQDKQMDSLKERFEEALQKNVGDHLLGELEEERDFFEESNLEREIKGLKRIDLDLKTYSHLIRKKRKAIILGGKTNEVFKTEKLEDKIEDDSSKTSSYIIRKVKRVSQESQKAVVNDNKQKEKMTEEKKQILPINEEEKILPDSHDSQPKIRKIWDKIKQVVDF